MACWNAFTWLNNAKTWQCGIHNSDCGETCWHAVIIDESTTCLCRNKGTTANATNMPKYAWRDSVAIVQHNTQLVTPTLAACYWSTYLSQSYLNWSAVHMSEYDTCAVQQFPAVSSSPARNMFATELHASCHDSSLNQRDEPQCRSTQLKTINYFLECWSVFTPKTNQMFSVNRFIWLEVNN